MRKNRSHCQTTWGREESKERSALADALGLLNALRHTLHGSISGEVKNISRWTSKSDHHGHGMLSTYISLCSLTDMSFECIGCKKNFKNRRGYSGHVYRCPKFKEYQEQTLITLRESGDLRLSDQSWRHDDSLNMEVDGTSTETHSKQIDFSQNEASSSRSLTIVIPPVCTMKLYFNTFIFNLININIDP